MPSASTTGRPVRAATHERDHRVDPAALDRHRGVRRAPEVRFQRAQRGDRLVAARDLLDHHGRRAHHRRRDDERVVVDLVGVEHRDRARPRASPARPAAGRRTGRRRRRCRAAAAPRARSRRSSTLERQRMPSPPRPERSRCRSRSSAGPTSSSPSGVRQRGSHGAPIDADPEAVAQLLGRDRLAGLGVQDDDQVRHASRRPRRRGCATRCSFWKLEHERRAGVVAGAVDPRLAAREPARPSGARRRRPCR